MSAPDAVEFAGTEEELEKYAAEFAASVGGWAARDPRRGGHVVAGGTAFSTNPNTVPWRLRLLREGGRLLLRPEGWAPPWTRARSRRIVAFRAGQLADFLETRLRGGGSEKFADRRFREPFAPFGSGPAALTASFAWTVACGTSAFAASLAAFTLVSLGVMDVTIGEISARVAIVQRAGGLPLPTPSELASIGPGFRLGCALNFGGLVAFFFALLHALSLWAGEIWPRAARLGQASLLFQAAMLVMALFPVLPPWAAIPAALLVPMATHAGYALVWGRRRERVREETRTPRRLLITGAVLAAVLAFALIPRPAGAQEMLAEETLFRDRWLLGSHVGRAIAAFYYRHTLYAAHPFKRWYSSAPEKAQRLQRTAAVADPAAAAHFRALHFTVEPAPSGGRHDVAWDGRRLTSGGSEAPWDGRRESLAEALEGLAEATFRSGTLAELHSLGWTATYYLGPLACVLFVAGLFSPGVSILFRVLPRRSASWAVLAVLVACVAAMLWDDSTRRDDREAIAALRADAPADRIAAGLGHRSWAVRHEAAYRAYRGADPSLLQPLLRAADDPDLRVRLWACGALGKTGNPASLLKLLERLRDDPEIFVRYRAAEGLGLLGREEAVGPLVEMMKRRSWYEGLYALKALRRIQPDRF